MKELKITSKAFIHNELIPEKYSCDGENVNPPIEIGNVPNEAKSLVLIVDDPDAPIGTWTHWVVWNIPTDGIIGEDCVPGEQGLNSSNEKSYVGPCPPYGMHRYFFKAFALDRILDFKPWTRKEEIENAMKGHIVAQGELVGKYERK
jgi:Raf kinase inhibitor-like YbhB/YbcL family protein